MDKDLGSFHGGKGVLECMQNWSSMCTNFMRPDEKLTPDNRIHFNLSGSAENAPTSHYSQELTRGCLPWVSVLNVSLFIKFGLRDFFRALGMIRGPPRTQYKEMQLGLLAITWHSHLRVCVARGLNHQPAILILINAHANQGIKTEA